jgi:hypothetical protein
VEWDLQHGGPSKSTSLPDTASKKSTRGKAAVGFGSRAPRMSRVDSGLQKSRSDTTTALSVATRAKKSVRGKHVPVVRFVVVVVLFCFVLND